MKEEIRKMSIYSDILNYSDKDVANFTEIYIIRHMFHAVLQKGGNKWLSH